MSDEIADVVGDWPGSGSFIDAFCGTGAVALKAARLGWPIRLNDHLINAVTIASAQLLSPDDVPFHHLGGYDSTVSCLNALRGKKGFIWREYSPASASCGIERRYFTEENGARIDSMRGQIERWRRAGAISGIEAGLLVADLLAAANRVANIAGTYGCFLREWTPNSLRRLLLAPRVLQCRPTHVEVSCLDVFDITARAEDTVYLDPPYTKRQYAAYYHLLETIAEGDSPKVSGVTGLRPWKHMASPFCYKTRALEALVSLVSRLDAHRILVSYSDEGHIALEDLRRGFSELGDFREHRLATIGRYRPNGQASANRSSVAEYLLEIRRDPAFPRKQRQGKREAA